MILDFLKFMVTSEFFWVAVGVMYLLFLFHLGKKDKHKKWFYVLIHAAWVLPFILLFLISPIGLFIGILALPTWIQLLLLIFVVERYVWGITLREASGKDRLVWFYIIAPFPLIGWFFYRAVQVR